MQPHTSLKVDDAAKFYPLLSYRLLAVIIIEPAGQGKLVAIVICQFADHHHSCLRQGHVLR